MISQKDLEQAVVGRTKSLFGGDFERDRRQVSDAIRGSRMLVIGGAGSIGGAFVKLVAQFEPRAVHIVDPSENGLVEVVRDLRGGNGRVPDDFKTVAIGFDEREFDLYFASQPKYDYVLNFGALKHVRSERDPYTLMRMLRVNVLANENLIRLAKEHGVGQLFAVSSDKAVSPASLMGASKAYMERVFLSHGDSIHFNSARFANVAFSEGSLLRAFLQRLEKGQALAAPNDIKRFFITHEEAAQLCLLAVAAGRAGEIFVPTLDPDDQLKNFSDIAALVLERQGLQAVECATEEEAKAWFADNGSEEKKWPCYFSSSNTSGEKAYEEFVGHDESLDGERYSAVGVITQPAQIQRRDVEASSAELEDLRQCGEWDKSTLVKIVSRVVPELNHLETDQNLDQKM